MPANTFSYTRVFYRVSLSFSFYSLPFILISMMLMNELLIQQRSFQRDNKNTEFKKDGAK